MDNAIKGKNGESEALYSLAGEVERWTGQRKACSADWSWASSSRRWRHKWPNYIEMESNYMWLPNSSELCVDFNKQNMSKLAFFLVMSYIIEGKICLFDVLDHSRKQNTSVSYYSFFITHQIWFQVPLNWRKWALACSNLTFNSRT